MDFSVYIGPAIVLLVMLVALLSFGIWGARSIRESAETVAAVRELAANSPSGASAPVVGDVSTAEQDLSLLPGTEHSQAAADQPDDSQVYGAFAQSFVDGAEVAVGAQPDYTEAISRIKADLDAEAARCEEETAASLEKAAAGVDANAAEDATADNEAAVGDATRFFSAGESAALRTADDMADDGEADPDAAAIAAVAEVSVGMEETRVLTDLDAETADDKNLNSILEETRLISDTPVVAGPVSPTDYETAAPAGDALMPEAPLPFGGRIAWLAVPGYKPSEVIAALRLADIEPANWTAGLTQAYSTDDKVFVSPVLDGWVLVIGKTLWRKADMNRSAENIDWLKDVGRMFGNACFFSSMKGLGNHGWVGIRDGEIARAYGYSGELQELIWLVGEPTEEEIAINPGFASEVQERSRGDFRPIIPDEKMVLELATRWSIDPTFAKKQYPVDFGFLGRME